MQTKFKYITNFYFKAIYQSNYSRSKFQTGHSVNAIFSNFIIKLIHNATKVQSFKGIDFQAVHQHTHSITQFNKTFFIHFKLVSIRNSHGSRCFFGVLETKLFPMTNSDKF
jgi:hypothetical protein